MLKVKEHHEEPGSRVTTVEGGKEGLRVAQEGRKEGGLFRRERRKEGCSGELERRKEKAREERRTIQDGGRKVRRAVQERGKKGRRAIQEGENISCEVSQLPLDFPHAIAFPPHNKRAMNLITTPYLDVESSIRRAY